MSNVAETIRLSDTADQWNRRVHINVRNDKATMVYRWKDSKSSKNHTQRITLTDEQALRLVNALTKAVVTAIHEASRVNEAMAILDKIDN
uniref:Uncharacterized protein 4.5 n=1 Tax=Escherichia phage T7 TaxID=10760 RepID=A9XKZ7_BPT7|nr:hypothetical protein [Escherichia phage T7]